MKKISAGIIFFCSFLFSFLIYYPTVEAKLVFDFMDFIGSYTKNGGGIYYPETHHISPYITSKIVSIILFTLFGFSAVKWHIVSCLLFAATTTVLYQLVKNIVERYSEQNVSVIALTAALFFLVSPYQTEVLVWAGAFNYLIVGLLVLCGLYFTERYTSEKKSVQILLAAISFLLAAFTHEWGLFGIVSAFCLYVFLTPAQKIFSRITLKFLLANIVVVGIYFFNQWLSGEWIAHYGADVHLRFHFNEMVTAFYKYLLKIILLSGFWSAERQTQAYNVLQQPVVNSTLGIISIIFLFYCIYRVFFKKDSCALPLLFFVLFSLFVFPVLNLYFPYENKIMADRYCYLTGAFLYTSLIIILSRAKWFRYIVAIYTAVMFCLLCYNIQSWRKAAALITSLENNFAPYQNKRVFFLNMPDNYRGAYMFRSGFGSGMSGWCRKRNGGDECIEKLSDVCSYNMLSDSDSVKVQIVDSTSLRVQLTNKNAWWWYYGTGARNYENERFKVELDNDASAYTVRFKRRQAEDVILYQAGGNWHEIKKF